MIIVTGNIDDNSDIKTDKIAVQVKYLSNVWRTLGMSLIATKNLVLTLSCFFLNNYSI